MKKILYSAALVLAFALLCFSTEQVKQKGECTPSFQGRINAQVPCEADLFQQKTIDNKSKFPENAIIKEEKRTGLLLGGGTFFLADRSLEGISAGATYVWAKGYAIELKPTPGE